MTNQDTVTRTTRQRDKEELASAVIQPTFTMTLSQVQRHTTVDSDNKCVCRLFGLLYYKKNKRWQLLIISPDNDFTRRMLHLWYYIIIFVVDYKASNVAAAAKKL